MATFSNKFFPAVFYTNGKMKKSAYRFDRRFLELLAGFDPATSSLPRSRAKTRRRKNTPIYLRKAFAINHNI